MGEQPFGLEHYVVIEGTGHLSPLEVPGQVASQLDQFTASLDPARR